MAEVRQPAKRGRPRQRPVTYKTTTELRDGAAKARAAVGYDGRMTPALLLELAPLLNEPIDSRYIETIGKVEGKPYVSTGIRSVQVQVDRLNAVLGEPHWRKMLHYVDGGAVCQAHVVVGNDLAHASLTESDGQLVTVTAGTGGADNRSRVADVIAHRSGWGGHSRGRNRGDLYKGSETNALKRCIAQLGPGHEVYCLDLDEDNNVTGPEYRAKAAPAEAPAEPEDKVASLAALLALEDDLAPLRAEVDRGLQLLKQAPERRWTWLSGAGTAQDLEAMRTRIQVALDQQAAEDEAAS